MEFNELWSRLPGPVGWLRLAEAKELYRLARDTHAPGVIVEIGSWQGRSAITLAMAAATPVFCVDPHKDTYAHRKHNIRETETAFRKNIEKFGVSNLVVPIVAQSTDAIKSWDKPIRLLWVDGHHDYPLVDYLLWEPFLVKGGVIGLHDIDHYGARKVVRHFLKNSEKFSHGRQVVFSYFAEKVWSHGVPTPFLGLKCSWEMLFVTVNQWLKVIEKNEDTKKHWHTGLPYSWWRHMTKARFLHELPFHLDFWKEPLWFKWEFIIYPIQKKDAGNYPL